MFSFQWYIVHYRYLLPVNEYIKLSTYWMGYRRFKPWVWYFTLSQINMRWPAGHSVNLLYLMWARHAALTMFVNIFSYLISQSQSSITDLVGTIQLFSLKLIQKAMKVLHPWNQAEPHSTLYLHIYLNGVLHHIQEYFTNLKQIWLNQG